MFPDTKWYLFFIFLGILFGGIYLFRHLKLTGEKQIISFCSALFFSLLCFYLGALLFDAFFHRSRGEMHFHGITFLGGLISGISAFCLFYWLFKLDKDLMSYLDVIGPSICLAHVFGRIGCFFAGCCFGKPSEIFLAFKVAIDAPAYEIYPYYSKILPVQLFEALALLIIFIILTRLKNKKFAMYLILYSLARFFLEFLRGDNRGVLIGILSPAQELCVVLFLLGFFIKHQGSNKSTDS